MRLSVANMACVGFAQVLVLGCALHAVPALAYTGGAIRARVVGIEPTMSRIFYYRTFHDESGAGPEVWFFDLNAANPEVPRRAPELDGPDDGEWHGGENINQAWRELSSRLQPLTARRDFDVRLTLHADSVGVDSACGVTRYNTTVTVAVADRSETLELVAYDDTMLAIKGAYEIPGNRNVVVILTYRGRAYGSEEVELPVLILVK